MVRKKVEDMTEEEVAEYDDIVNELTTRRLNQIIPQIIQQNSQRIIWGADTIKALQYAIDILKSRESNPDFIQPLVNLFQLINQRGDLVWQVLNMPAPQPIQQGEQSEPKKTSEKTKGDNTVPEEET